MKPNEIEDPKSTEAEVSQPYKVVELGSVRELTAGNSSGQFEDKFNNRKDKYGGAGER